MRITGGRARGVPLRAPRGLDVRPATDRMREAVFSSLGGRVEGARFLDLFAGTGAYGLEALSRGAAGGVFVERNRSALACLRTNLEAVRKSLGDPRSEATIVPRDVLGLRSAEIGAADLVFADPPYGSLGELLPRLGEWLDGILRPEGQPVLVLEAPGGAEPVLPGWRCVKHLGKGKGQPVCGFWERG